ncbi:hypothetical protein ACYSNO_08890 [Enterococcus sp. LJL98]
MKELTIIEEAVIQLLPEGATRKITTKEISKLIDLDERSVFEVIRCLIKKGVPIVAIRNGKYEDRGLYIATTNEERSTGLHALKEQTNDMALRIKQVESADLKHWKNNLEFPSKKLA